MKAWPSLTDTSVVKTYRNLLFRNDIFVSRVERLLVRVAPAS